ncbi:hypothetical protein [Thermoactinomyces mirandus]|uniref:PD-(D/E)XK endonuclease-like domain-containing protein n=1 Tax=Thermoactinomyces mirandus TaxID=2756294 RepID=A0A7W2ASE5_9BACL|nr:hypothetical protein [Thermoactinomyces mirandus]MBA4603337.1 hypothetical protein [Thermoactinomyces mirandus]
MELIYTPSTNDVNDYLLVKYKSGKKILHLTPTWILESHRKIFIQQRMNRLKVKGFDVNEYIYEFNRWIKYIVKSKSLTKSEVLILIKRAIQKVYPQSEEWITISANLVNLFMMFRSSNMAIEEINKLSFEESWEIVVEIYQEYLRLAGKRPDLYSRFVDLVQNKDFYEFDELIMDGPFLFFNHLHECLMNRFEQLGKKVTLIVPFERSDQGVNQAYEIIRKVYSTYVPENMWKKIGTIDPGSSYLSNAPKVLFSDGITYRDESISFYQFSSIEQEISHIINLISKSVARQHISLRDVAIISPQSKKLRPMVKEIAEQYGLACITEDNQIKQLTTLDFIKILFGSKIDLRKRNDEDFFDINLFKRILNTDWYIGGKESLSSFEKIETFFEGLDKIDEWIDQFNKLNEVYEQIDFSDYFYHPLKGVNKKELELWQTILTEIKRFQEQLFDLGEKYISEYVNSLNEIISELESRIKTKQNDYFFFREVDKLLKEFIQISSESIQIKVTAEEFADLLIRFVSGEIEIEKKPEEVAGSNKLMVTSLHNIIYKEYKEIYVMQFNQNYYPYYEEYNWPMNTDLEAAILSATTLLKVKNGKEMEKLHADRFRYYFYCLFQSAKKCIRFSFSNDSFGKPTYPSPYFLEIIRSFGVDVNKKTDKLLDELVQEKILYKIMGYEAKDYIEEELKQYPVIKQFPDSLNFADLTTYRLCARRFYYLLKDPDSNVFSNEFQLGFYLARKVYKNAIRSLVNKYKGKEIPCNMLNSIIRLIPRLVKNALEEERKWFPLREDVINQAAYYAKLFAENFIGQIFTCNIKNPKVKFGDFISGEKFVIDLNEGKRVTVNKPSYVITKIYNNNYPFYVDDFDTFLVWSSVMDEKPQFSSWYMEKRKQLGDSKIKSIIDEALQTDLLKQSPSKTCSYCPYVNLCKNLYLNH